MSLKSVTFIEKQYSIKVTDQIVADSNLFSSQLSLTLSVSLQFFHESRSLFFHLSGHKQSLSPTSRLSDFMSPQTFIPRFLRFFSITLALIRRTSSLIPLSNLTNPRPSLSPSIALSYRLSLYLIVSSFSLYRSQTFLEEQAFSLSLQFVEPPAVSLS